MVHSIKAKNDKTFWEYHLSSHIIYTHNRGHHNILTHNHSLASHSSHHETQCRQCLLTSESSCQQSSLPPWPGRPSERTPPVPWVPLLQTAACTSLSSGHVPPREVQGLVSASDSLCAHWKPISLQLWTWLLKGGQRFRKFFTHTCCCCMPSGGGFLKEGWFHFLKYGGLLERLRRRSLDLDLLLSLLRCSRDLDLRCRSLLRLRLLRLRLGGGEGEYFLLFLGKRGLKYYQSHTVCCCWLEVISIEIENGCQNRTFNSQILDESLKLFNTFFTVLFILEHTTLGNSHETNKLPSSIKSPPSTLFR